MIVNSLRACQGNWTVFYCECASAQRIYFGRAPGDSTHPCWNLGCSFWIEFLFIFYFVVFSCRYFIYCCCNIEFVFLSLLCRSLDAVWWQFWCSDVDVADVFHCCLGRFSIAQYVFKCRCFTTMIYCDSIFWYFTYCFSLLCTLLCKSQLTLPKGALFLGVACWWDVWLFSWFLFFLLGITLGRRTLSSFLLGITLGRRTLSYYHTTQLLFP